MCQYAQQVSGKDCLQVDAPEKGKLLAQKCKSFAVSMRNFRALTAFPTFSSKHPAAVLGSPASCYHTVTPMFFESPEKFSARYTPEVISTSREELPF